MKQSKDIYQSLYNSTHFNKIFLEKKKCVAPKLYIFFFYFQTKEELWRTAHLHTREQITVTTGNQSEGQLTMTVTGSITVTGSCLKYFLNEYVELRMFRI